MNQRFLSEGNLHDKQGKLNEAGYATSLVKTYDRSRLRAGALRVKEWDYYLITDGRRALALTVADNGYMGLDSVSWIKFDKNSQSTTSMMSPFPMGKRGLPASSVSGDVHARGRGYHMTFAHENGVRHLFGHQDIHCGQTLDFDITLSETGPDSMVIVTPFQRSDKAFYYNQKINCLAASGVVRLGLEQYTFRDGAYAVLDWGRGVWTYDNTWYWSSLSGRIGGKTFGFNLGYGFGDTSAASENMLFYDGYAHKLGNVTFKISKDGNGKDDYMRPWSFRDDEGRLRLTMTPMIDRAADTNVLLIRSDQHQVFGRFSGTVMLDSGEVLELENMVGFAEKVHNRW